MSYRITAFLLLALACGCRCPGPRSESTSGGSQSQRAHSAALKQNISYVEGVVDSVLASGEERFELLVSVSSVREGSGGFSMLESGSQVSVSPDLEREGKSSLSFFRQARRGGKFTGSITRTQEGRWLLFDAEARQ